MDATVRTDARDDTTSTNPRSRPALDTGQTELGVRASHDDDSATELYVPSPLQVIVDTARTDTEFRNEDSMLIGGAMIGDYRIERKIAEGGWGSVYSAIHPVIGRRAAIKVLKKKLSQQPAFVRRFIDEARAVTQIGHPNIVDVFTFGETTDGRSYFVMEWLKGETLWARLRRGALAVADICAIATQLADALEAAHGKGIIHRDLKPENVFLVETRDFSPRVKLLDFGLAKLATNETRAERTSTGEIIGTPHYMAPEQARGLRVDHRVDIYALGGILFSSLTGRTPYAGSNAADIIASCLTEPPPRPSSLVPDVPKKLDDLVVAMLAKDADHRPELTRVRAVLEAVQAASTKAIRRARPTRAPWRTPRVLRFMWSASAKGVRMVRLRTQVGGAKRMSLVVGAAAATAIIALIAIVGLSRGNGGRTDEPARSANTGGLILDVSGASAFEVLIDGRVEVPGPDREIPLAVGAHTVEITAAGMHPETFRVAIVPGRVLREPVVMQPAAK
jgi:tRNA A-37 threonylcarbamoyl transferase component Bud32